MRMRNCASALRLRSCPTPIPIAARDPAPALCHLRHWAAGFATLREQLVAVSELVGGIAVTISVALASGDGSNEWELEPEAVEVSTWIALCASFRVSNCHTTLGKALRPQGLNVER